MEEKTDEVLPATEESTLPHIDSDDNSAGNVDPDPEELLSTDAANTAETVETETVQASESAEESNVADASIISADSNTDLIESNFNLEDGSSSEVVVSETNGEATSNVADEINTSIVDDINTSVTNEINSVTDEIITSVTDQINTSASDEMNTSITDEIHSSVTDEIQTPADNLEETNVINNDIKPLESIEITHPEEPAIVKPEEKMEPVPAIDTSSAEYQLEEELKRLHGDTTDETKMDTFMGDISVTSILEDKEESKNKDNLDSTLTKTNNLLKINDLEDDKPITRDSDLEEMLSADVIMKEPELIKEAQDELKTTDVLVCGRCHEVYHFIEEFHNHKSQNCTAKSTIVPICEGESKPQVWGFTLWKTKQIRSLKPGEQAPTSWKTYQKWCKLAPIDKNAWISAGQTIQFCNKIASAAVTEVKTKVQSNSDKDPLALDGLESNKENSNLDNSSRVNKELVKTTPKPEPSSTPITKPNDVNSNKTLRTPSKSIEKSEFAVERIVAKRFNAKKKYWEYHIKWEHFPSDQNTWEPLTNLTHCKKMVENFEEQLRKLKADKAKPVGVVSKNRKLSTLSTSSLESSTGRPQRSSKQKALNQVKAWCGSISDEDEGGGIKRKLEDDDSDDSFEKKIKTEDFSDDSDFDLNTVMNSSKVPPLRKIPQKQPQPTIQILKNGLDKSGPLPHNILIPDANGVVRINQKQLPSLSTGVYIMSKTAGIIKLDSNTSKVATSGGQTIVKVAPKIGQTQIKIVKKDGSTTATTKQVIPITSTPIPTKIYKPVITKVKKPVDSPKKIQEIAKRPEMKKIPEVKKLTEIKKQPESLKLTPQQSKISKTKEEPKKTLTSMMDMSAPEDEDSDDGLEELPFPEEIKIPEPESPPGEFLLDPITGKIAGMEYPEKIEPEEPEPDPEPMEEEKSDSSLDNIVKLAAADITEDDLKNDDSMDDDHMMSHHEEDEEEMLHIPEKKSHLIRSGSMPTPSGMAKTIVRMPVGATNRPQMKTQQRQQGSILNKVLTGTPIIRRTSISSSPKVQQRVLNQSVLKNTYGSIVRVGNTTYVRKPAVTKRPKQVISCPSTRIIKSQHDPSSKNVYTYSRQVVQTGPRKVGGTTIRQATSLDLLAQQQKIQSSSTSLIANRPPITPGSVRRVVHASSNVQSSVTGISPVKKDPLIRQHQEQHRKLVMPTRNQKAIQQIQSQTSIKPKAVINMPSLLGDDDSEMDSPPELSKPSSPSPTSPFTTPVITTPTGLLESSAIDDSMDESMQDTMTGHSSAVDQMDQNPPTSEADGTNTVSADLSSFTLADNENPIFITGDDGTVYQVAGQNEQGQTILLTQGSDGQQQCLLVTSEVAEAMETASGQQEQSQPEVPAPEINESLTEPLSVKTEADTNDQVVAQVVRAEPPSPGGTHKVVVMLPDGNLMVTQVSPEEYASLELE